LYEGVEASKEEGPKFMQRLIAKQKARVKDTMTQVGKARWAKAREKAPEGPARKNLNAMKFLPRIDLRRLRG
jgi:hypothetical protein